MYTPNGLFAIVTPPADGQLLHSAITGIKATGEPEQSATLYVYDKQLLAAGHIRVYLQVNSAAESSLTLTDSNVSHDYFIDESSEWIYGDFSIPPDATVLKVLIQADRGNPIIKTYQLALKPSS